MSPRLVHCPADEVADRSVLLEGDALELLALLALDLCRDDDLGLCVGARGVASLYDVDDA
jgi:hypothetical protein